MAMRGSFFFRLTLTSQSIQPSLILTNFNVFVSSCFPMSQNYWYEFFRNLPLICAP